MLEKVIEQTKLYIENMPKEERKKYGQFFTSKETAIFMASLCEVPDNVSEISILDPGAGSGILSCALIQRLQDIGYLKKINLVCYENDYNIIGLLKDNLEYIKNKSKIKIDYEIKYENYILGQYLDFNGMIGADKNCKKYDIVIGNPPYLKISKDKPEAIEMSEICYGAPNMYFLFAAMSVFNLKEDGQMVYIIPRSWTSGAYFRRFREYIFSYARITHIHLFVSRNKVFKNENVLQETMILKLIKTNKIPHNVIISSSHTNNDFNEKIEYKVPYNTVISGTEKYVYLVTQKSEIDVLNVVNNFKNTLPDLGLKMKTGLIVDFRNKDLLRNTKDENTIPLLYSQNIIDGMVRFPVNKEYQYIVPSKKGHMQKNKNYLFVKRFTAKEEKRRLQCGIYLADSLPEYSFISTQNKINFIDGIEDDLSKDIVYGLYVVFNSTIYDIYYRILNGSTQVNSTEINNIPMPSLDEIKEMGNKIIKSGELSQKACDVILEEIIKDG